MRHKPIFLTLFWTLFFASSISSAGAAQGDFTPTLCQNANGAYYRAGLFPQFKDTNNRLVLANWNTGETVLTLAESLPYQYRFEWSPDCHYLIGISLHYYDWLARCDAGLFAWDAVSGEQKLAVNRFCDNVVASRPRIFWRPDATAALFSEWCSVSGVAYSCGTRFIWYPQTDQRVDLQEQEPGGAYVRVTLDMVAWDDSRGWLWANTGVGIAAFDRATGAVVRNFRNPPQDDTYPSYTRSSFVFSPDQTKVIAYGQHSWDGYESAATTVYDIASGTPTQVNVERNGAGIVALSSDNRYLVMGYTALRVWDLSNLPANVEDRLPIRRIGIGGERIVGLHFVSGTMVEVTTQLGTDTWDILTGAFIS